MLMQYAFTQILSNPVYNDNFREHLYFITNRQVTKINVRKKMVTITPINIFP